MYGIKLPFGNEGDVWVHGSNNKVLRFETPVQAQSRLEEYRRDHCNGKEVGAVHKIPQDIE